MLNYYEEKGNRFTGSLLAHVQTSEFGFSQNTRSSCGIPLMGKIHAVSIEQKYLYFLKIDK